MAIYSGVSKWSLAPAPFAYADTLKPKPLRMVRGDHRASKTPQHAWYLSKQAYVAPMLPLYHVMGFKKALSVFASNTMPARWLHKIPGQPDVVGTSLSRNARFDRFDSVVRLVFEGTALRQRHRIMPLDAEVAFRHQFGYSPDVYDRTQNGICAYAEEFVLGDIVPLSRMLRGVSVQHLQTLSGAQASDVYSAARTYATAHGLPLAVSAQSIKRLREVNTQQMWSRWEEEEEQEEE